jgi:hypothetical protein
MTLSSFIPLLWSKIWIFTFEFFEVKYLLKIEEAFINSMIPSTL